VHEIQGEVVFQVFELLEKSVCEPGKPAHSHPHGEF
jgi:hypothetical protein